MHSELKQLLGPGNYLDSPENMATYLKPWRGEAIGTAALVALPGSTAQLSEVVKYCAAHMLPMVPQSGNTGLVYGSLSQHENAVIINTSRMRAIRNVDAADGSMVVEAGVTLTQIQEAAEKAGKFFPLSMASEGSAMLGGMAATNPGGTAVLRYGNFRDLVLGLEVVLPNGEIWSDLKTLRKDNAGYELKHLFIGSEGTLGIVTAASLRLFPEPKQKSTALLAVNSAVDAQMLLTALQSAIGSSLSAYELIADACVNVVLEHIPTIQFPLSARFSYYVLLEVSSEMDTPPLGELLEQHLASIWESGLVQDAVIAASGQQAQNLWDLRENISESARHFGRGIHFDIAVPVGKVAEFLDSAGAAIKSALPEVTTIAFGHMGDGNIHYNQYFAKDAADDAMESARVKLEEIIYDECIKCGGTVSAEHGIGLDRQEAFYKHADPVYLQLMQNIKFALDPHGIMNPGKVLK